jgi:hypothetical protein|nr:MAG TPA: hypothetical protein [Caudoviricetes sp.]
MDNTEEIEVMTYDEAYYLDVESTKASDATADIQLMNVGVTKFEESSNPTEKSTQYIGDKAKSNKVTGYDNQFAIESDLIKNNKVIEYLYNIFRSRKTGKYAQQDLFIVELWNPVASKAGSFKARKLKTTAVISSKTPNPGETITFSGDLKGIGDFVDGTFDTTTKTFTPNA